MKKNRSKKHMNRKKEIETEYKKIYEKIIYSNIIFYYSRTYNDTEIIISIDFKISNGKYTFEIYI